MEKRIVAAFDFDGTITDKDTFTCFIRFSKGNFLFFCGFLLFSPLLAAYKLKLYPNWKIKQKVFAFFFKGMKIQAFNKLCEDFCKHTNIIRPKAKRALLNHIEHGDTLVIISASIKNWVLPFTKEFGVLSILCTELDVDKNDCLTGTFSTPNCYGKEKVNRLLTLFPQRDTYYLVAYGDSRGDKELLEFADETYFRKFE